MRPTYIQRHGVTVASINSLSLAWQHGTHYRMTFAKSQTLTHLSTI